MDEQFQSHSVNAFQSEVDGLKRFINVHTTVFVLMSFVIVSVGLVMLFRLRTTPEHVLARVSVIEKKLDEKLSTRPSDVAKKVDKIEEVQKKILERITAIEEKQ